MDFDSFNLLLTPIALSNENKLRPLNYILKTNYWMRYRLEGGTNLRSDLRAALYNKAVSGPYRAAKLIGCRPQSAYQPWKEILKVQNITGS